MTGLLSRLAALLILVLVLAALWLLLGVPLQERIAADRAQVTEQAQMLARFQALAAAEPQLRQQLDSLASNQPLRDLLLPGTSEAQAAASLQELAKAVLASSGAPLVTLQPLTAEPVAGHRRIALKLQFTADTPALQRLLHTLESGRPLVLVDALQVRARTSELVGFSGRQGVAEGAPVATSPPLDVTMEISSFMVTGGPS